MIGAQLQYVNYFGAEETGSGGPARVRVTLEYPYGTFTHVKFNGGGTGEMVDGGQIISDPIDTNIPDGAIFNEWVIAEFSNGAIFNITSPKVDLARLDPDMLDKPEEASGMSAAQFVYGATAIIGLTTKPSVLILGDSRSSGVAEGFTTNDLGNVARAIGSSFGYINLAVGGASMWQFRVHHKKTPTIASVCSHVVIAGHINDINGNSSARVLQANAEALIGKFARNERPAWMCTIEPFTRSTDGWKTVEGQVPWDATKEEVRKEFNDIIRSGTISGMVGYFDLADAVESARNSGKWMGGQPLTDDGLHCNIRGELQLVRSVNPAVFGTNAFPQ